MFSEFIISISMSVSFVFRVKILKRRIC